MVIVKKRSFRVQQIRDILGLMWCKCGGVRRHQRWSTITPMIFRLEVAFDHHPRLERNLSVMATATQVLTSEYFLEFWTSYKPYVVF